MMRRYFPFFPTLLVGGAVITMLLLGIWQLERRGEKAALLETYRTNMAKPSLDVFPTARPVPDSAMFRTATVACKPFGEPQIRGGKDAVLGATIFRIIVSCRLPDKAVGPDNPVFYVDIGGSEDPAPKPMIVFGMTYTGTVTTMPPEGSFILRAFRKEPPPAAFLIASKTTSPGLVPSAPPNIEDVPNDHLAYAIQWFLFAGFALIIYVAALRKRLKPA